MNSKLVSNWIAFVGALFLLAQGCYPNNESSGKNLTNANEDARENTLEIDACSFIDDLDSVLEPAEFIRSKGKPVKEYVSFQVPSDGYLCVVVTNGIHDPPHGHRVSSAWIDIDGDLVIDPDSFSQVTETIHQSIPIAAGEHELAVKLASKPDSFISVELGLISGDAYDVIGPGGGVITVMDPSSPALGTSVIIPEGALDEDTPIIIRSTEDSPLLIDFNRVGPLVELLPSGITFNAPVTLVLPYSEESLPDLYSESEVSAHTVEHGGLGWTRLDGFVDEENNVVEVPISDFSPFCNGVSRVMLCESLTADVRYDGCLMPDHQNQENPWEEGPGTNGIPAIDNCQLILPVNWQWGQIQYQRDEPALLGAPGYTMDARIKVTDHNPGIEWLVKASFGISDGLKIPNFYIFYATDSLHVAVCDSADCSVQIIRPNAYNDYRIEVVRDAVARFYIDGELFHESSYEQLKGSNIPPRLMVFGGAESVTYWDEVNYSVCGVVEPFKWLEDHPTIGEAVNWQTVNTTTKIPWYEWPEERKDQLRVAFHKSRYWMSWYRQGMVGNEPVPVDMVEFPDNILFDESNPPPPWDQVGFRIVEDDAWKMYLAHLAWSLMVEIDRESHGITWSMVDYQISSVEEILSGKSMFITSPVLDPAGYGLNTRTGTILPSPPAFIHKNLGDILYGDSHREVVSRLIEWMWDIARHQVGLGGQFWHSWNHWQYWGPQSASKIITGTVCVRHSLTPPDAIQGANTCVQGEFAHWITGCSGSVGFMREVLRIFNIPTVPVPDTPNPHADAYFSELFISELLMYITSGDHVFGSRYLTGFEPKPGEVPPYEYTYLSGDELLTDEETYDLYFQESMCWLMVNNNSSRPFSDKMVETLSVAVVDLACMDLFDGHVFDNGSVVLQKNGSVWQGEDVDTDGRIVGIWGSSPDHIWAVGDVGKILHWNVDNWSSEAPDSISNTYLNDIFGTSNDDVWAVGDGGSLVHWHDDEWSSIESNTTKDIYGVWAGTGGEVWIVGEDGTIHRKSGAWTIIESNTSKDLNDVWGATTGEVWVVGDYGTTIRCLAQNCYTDDSGTQENLNAVWGISQSDVLAVGDNGNILRWIGGSWSSDVSPTTSNLNGIWGTSAFDIWAVGDDGTIIHNDGIVWSVVNSGTTSPLRAVWSHSTNVVYTTGGGFVISDTGQSSIYNDDNFYKQNVPACDSYEYYGMDPLIEDWGKFLDRAYTKAATVCSGDLDCGCQEVTNIPF